MGWLDAVDVVADQTRRAVERQAAMTPAQQMEEAHQQQVIQARNAAQLSRWSNVAPTVPSGALMSFVQNGITPESDLGQWVVTQAQQGLQAKQPPSAFQAIQGLRNIGITDPSQLGFQEPQQGSPHIIKPAYAASGIDASINKGLTTAARGAFAGMQAGAEATGALFKQAAGATAENISNAAHGKFEFGAQNLQPESVQSFDIPTPSLHPPKFLTEPLNSPSFSHDLANPATGAGVDVTHSTLKVSPDYDPASQLTAVQALRGKSMGSGIFPGGPALQAAQEAQRQAASINGHALTPGRAVATLVAEPGSKPYAVLSGAVDAYVALKADPAALAISGVTDAAKAAKLFSPTSDGAIAATADHLIDRLGPGNAAALQEWAGHPDDLRQAIVDKITNDPSSLQQLVDNGTIDAKKLAAAIEGRSGGLVDGLRPNVNPQNAMSWLNGPAGSHFVKWAQGASGYDIYMKSGKKIPAPIAWALGDTTDENQIRSLLGQHVGLDIRDVPSNYEWAHPFDGMRWYSKLPNYAVDSADPEAMTQRAIQELQVGKVPKSEWNDLLRPLATAANRNDAYQGYIKIGNRIGDEILARTPGYQKTLDAFTSAKAELERTGVETPEYRQLNAQVGKAQRDARSLTTYFTKNAEEDRKWWTDTMGNTPYVSGLSLDGEPTPIEGPYAPSELLNRSIPVIGGDGTQGIRNVKRAVSDSQRLWAVPGVKQARNGGTYVADHLTGVFKIGALARLALPIRFLADEQARMATAGVDSMFHHPLSYLSYVVNGGTAEDLTGEKFIQQLADHQSKVTQAIGQTSSLAEELRGQSDKVFAKGWGTYSQDNPNYVYSWGDRLSAAHIDPVGGQVAKAITDPEGTGGLAAVKQAFWDGKLAEERQGLINADLKWGSANLTQRAQSDAYIDGWVQRLHDLTGGGQQDMLQAVATGEPWHGGETSSAFRKALSDYRDQGVGPKSVVGPIAFDREDPHMFKRATNAMFSALMGAPTGKLTRSPAFRQFYYQRAEELLPHLSAEDRAAVVERAATGGMKIVDSGAAAEGGRITLEDADTIAKAYALKQSHELLYYPGSKMNVSDTLRNVAPFGEAWKNVITTWAKLATANPVVGRRVQQGVTDARESGFWYKDPQDGIEKMVIVPAGIMQDISGVPFQMSAPVKGLNIAAQGLPGFGPAITWPAAGLLSKLHESPATNFLHKMVLPYGDPDFSGGTTEALFPGWVNKLKTTGWFTKLPFVGQSQDEQRVLSNVQKQALQYYISTGHYDTSNPEVLARLEDKAMSTAKALYMWRGMAQFASPAAPAYTVGTQLASKSASSGGGVTPEGYKYLQQTLGGKPLKDGSVIETWMMAQAYKKMLTDANGDSFKATMQFVNMFGADRVLNTGGGTFGQPYTHSDYNLPTTAETQAWSQDHAGFVKAYPQFAGYFASQSPSNGGFDYNAYLQQIHSGQRKPLDADTWVKMAEARLGNAVYAQQRSKLPASPDKSQQQWLDNWHSYLMDQYQGFGQDQYSASASRDKAAQLIHQLPAVLQNREVKNTPLAQAASQYMQKRDEALATAQGRGYTTLSGKEVGDLRDWLFQWGNWMVQQHPEFQTMWDNLFLNEVDPNA